MTNSFENLPIGKSNRNRKYDIRGSTAGKVFNALGAISALVVGNNSGLLLEIQVYVKLIMLEIKPINFVLV